MMLDRAAAERKDPDWVAEQLRDPRSVVVAATRDSVLLDATTEPRLHRAAGPAARLIGAADEAILLGLDSDGAAVFAIDLERHAQEALVAGARLVALRDAGTLLSHGEGGLAAYTIALLSWHRVSGFCANCGAATDVMEAGYSRHCPRCGRTHFPRTDPAVIMLVAHDETVLLGRRQGWPGGRYSILAGFVSPGESLEEAVVREVREESGIECSHPLFVASQPWPFPSSLMLGFTARSDGGEPRALDGELEDVRWFTRDEVAAALAGEESSLQLPPSVSIAHLLLERWATGRLGDY
jgi:NAD+ diphosphatase